MNVDMDNLGHKVGKAKIMGMECRKVETPEVSVIFRNAYQDVQIFSFVATPKFCGHGSKAMTAICQIADINRINLVLKPEKKPDFDKLDFDLVKFYSKFGFEKINEGEMFRKYNSLKNCPDGLQKDNILSRIWNRMARK